jgi:integrase
VAQEDRDFRYTAGKLEKELPVITDRQVKKVIAQAPASGKSSIELKEAGERGSGGLAMIIRPGAGGVTAEWYAVYYVAGAREMAKLGSYPLLGVAEARRVFAAEWAPKIAAGENPAVARRQAAAVGTLGELRDAYLASLRDARKRVADLVEGYPKPVVAEIGAGRPAATIGPEDIVPCLATIHSRGAAAHANTVRTYIAAMFSFGLKAEHDFTRQQTGGGWGLKTNPASAIPANKAARRVGNRFLSKAELRAFWHWLLPYRTESLIASAILLRIATGQRTEEILKIATMATASAAPDKLAAYDRAAGTLYWGKTKNKLPHTIPLPRQAIEVLEGVVANSHGLYFPNQKDPRRLAVYGSVREVICKFLRENKGFQPFTARDLRRTFKTLAGDAGISKEMRDRLQNHVDGGVSTRNYDRHSYWNEKVAAMETWADYLDRVIAGTVDADRGNVVPMRKAEEAVA